MQIAKEMKGGKVEHAHAPRSTIRRLVLHRILTAKGLPDSGEYFRTAEWLASKLTWRVLWEQIGFGWKDDETGLHDEEGLGLVKETSGLGRQAVLRRAEAWCEKKVQERREKEKTSTESKSTERRRRRRRRRKRKQKKKGEGKTTEREGDEDEEGKKRKNEENKKTQKKKKKKEKKKKKKKRARMAEPTKLYSELERMRERDVFQEQSGEWWEEFQ